MQLRNCLLVSLAFVLSQTAASLAADASKEEAPLRGRAIEISATGADPLLRASMAHIGDALIGEENNRSASENALESLLRLRREVMREITQEKEEAHTAAGCRSTPTALCLLGRFIVSAGWVNPYAPGSPAYTAGAVQLTGASGYMYFFNYTVMEVPIKMLPFCNESPSTVGIFFAGLSDFDVSILVIDTYTGLAVLYRNPGFHKFDTVIEKRTDWPCF